MIFSGIIFIFHVGVLKEYKTEKFFKEPILKNKSTHRGAFLVEPAERR